MEEVKARLDDLRLQHKTMTQAATGKWPRTARNKFFEVKFWYQSWKDRHQLAEFRKIGLEKGYVSLMEYVSSLMDLERFDEALEILNKSGKARSENPKELDSIVHLTRLNLDKLFDVRKIDFDEKKIWISRKDLRQKDFKNVNFADSYIVYSDLRGARFEGADLSDTGHLSSSRLTDATYDCRTKFPKDFESEKFGMRKVGASCPAR